MRNTNLPFPERGKELLSLLKATGGADLLVYTPREFTREQEKNGFVAQVLQEAIEVEGEQKGRSEMVETARTVLARVDEVLDWK